MSWFRAPICAHDSRLDPPEAVLLLSQSRGSCVRRRIGEATPARESRPARTTRSRQSGPRSRKKAAPTKAAAGASQARAAAAARARSLSPAPAAAAPPPVRKPGFYEAVAIYERGVQALQRHDFQAAAGFFRTVLERYPEERELLERARLYLRVCERETVACAVDPQDPRGTGLRRHRGAELRRSRRRPRPPAARARRGPGERSRALHHGGRARHARARRRGARSPPPRHRLNPENRSLARQDPDLEAIRDHESFRSVLDTPPAAQPPPARPATLKRGPGAARHRRYTRL